MGLPRPATWRRLTPVVVAVVLLAACAGQAAPRPLPLAPTAIPATAVARTATATAQVVNLDADIQARIAATRRVVFLVPFSHWDTDWHDGYSSYAEQADRNILAAVQLARREPRFRYAFEQVLFVQHFWDTYPQYRADLAALVRTRQLTFAWGGITQPETSLVAPAVQARNLQLGDDWITSTFGIAPPRSAWQSDAFGNAASFPQFLDLSRVPYVFLGRVTNTCPQRPCDNPLPHAFYWSSPVNPQQRVLATYLTYSTALGAVRDKDDAAQQVALRAVIDKETARASGSKYLFLPFGDDFASPTAALPALVDRWNAANPDTYLVMADPGTAFDYLATQPLPQITADRNPAWQAFYGTRPAAKIADKDSEYLLTAADKFAALLGEEPTAGLTAAWQDAAANAHYDNISGVSFDQVWEESQRPRFARAVAGATGALVGTLARIVGGVAAPLVVFNPTSWSRSGVVELHGDLPPAVLASLPGTVQRVDPQTVAFWAEAVPPVGYAATASLPAHTVAHPATVAQDGPRTTLSNGLVRVTLDAARGGAFSSLAAAGGPELLAALGDDVVYLDDTGDVYGGQFGAEHARESAVPAQITVLASGPLIARVRVTFTLSGQLITKVVTLQADSPRLDVALDLAALPQTSALVQTATSRVTGMRTDDLGFSALTHPVDDRPITPGTSTYRREVFYPITAWSDVSADGAGLTLITHGLQGLGGTSTLNLLLARQVDGGGKPDSEGLTDRATHRLRYAYLPHTGAATQPWQASYDFNQPLISAWRADDHTVAVQLPFIGDVPSDNAPRLLPRPPAARAFPARYSLLAAASGIVADLVRHDGRLDAVAIDYDPPRPTVLAIAGRSVQLPTVAFSVTPIVVTPVGGRPPAPTLARVSPPAEACRVRIPRARPDPSTRRVGVLEKRLRRRSVLPSRG